METDLTAETLDQILFHCFEELHATDVCFNGTREVFLDRGIGMEPLPPGLITGLTEEVLKKWLIDKLARCGKSWDARHPFVDATLRSTPRGESSDLRLHALFPPTSPQGLLISLRRLPQSMSPHEAKVQASARWGHSPLFHDLREAVLRRETILVSGSTGSGKTTLTNDLLSFVPESERVIILEDTPELAPGHPHFLNLTSRPESPDGYGEITLRQLLKQSLRMRPDRIILGECRGPEVLDLLQALNSGHQGTISTLHSNSPREALKRIELLCMLSGQIPLGSIRELLALGIQWIVQVERKERLRQITSLTRIEGREGDTLLLRPIRHSH